MLFSETNFNDRRIEPQFHLRQLNHKTTWKHYYECYNYTIKKILDAALKGNYILNGKARAILFLFRHSLELCLKYNLELKNENITNTHDFNELYLAFSDQTKIPQNFKNLASQLNFDEFGASFRYYINSNTDRPFFDKFDKIEIAQFIEIYNSIQSTNDFFVGKLSDEFDYSKNKIRWDLTFHLGECDSLYHIKHQYDETIELLIDGIINHEYDAKKIYLPILFLIRHSLEIGLKTKILEIQEISDDRIKNKDYSNEHSLSTLYNCYYDFLSKLDTKKLDTKTQKDLQQYILQYNNLNDIIHNLDVNSFYFRYPVDKNGNPYTLNLTRLKLINIIRLFYFTDPFITFTNEVLRDNDLIQGA